jgi:hypothetical protein
MQTSGHTAPNGLGCVSWRSPRGRLEEQILPSRNPELRTRVHEIGVRLDAAGIRVERISLRF